MRETGYFRGSGGTIYKMDLPLSENLTAQLEKGTLSRVQGDVVEVQGGEGEGTHYVLAHANPDAEDTDLVPEGSIEKVLAWVGTDRDRAQRALMAETGKGDNARASLTKKLAELVTGKE